MRNSKEYKKQEARPEKDMLPADFRELGEAAQPLYQLLCGTDHDHQGNSGCYKAGEE